MLKGFLALVAIIALGLGVGFAQSNPGFVFGQIPTAAQWNSFFSSKIDVANGILISPGQLYVATAANGGSDSADCLTASVVTGHGPCLTLQHAVNVAMSYDMNSQWQYINIGTGTFVGASVTGSLRGSGGSEVSGQYIVFKGNGSGNTTITGIAGINQDIETSNGAQVGIQALTLQVSANGYGIGTQTQAVTQIISDVKFVGQSTASAVAIHAESEATVETASSLTTTFSGSFEILYSVGLGGYVEYDPGGGTVVCSGLTLGDSGHNGFWVQLDTAKFLWGTSWVFSGCGSLGSYSYPYDIYNNSILRNYTGTAQPFPGTNQGFVTTGARLSPAILPSVIFVSGLGTNGSGAMLSGSSDYSGVVVLTTTTSTGVKGDVTLTFGEQNVMNNGGNAAVCIATPMTGTGVSGAAWADGATTKVETNVPGQIQFQWEDNGVNLTNNSTLNLAYVCNN